MLHVLVDEDRYERQVCLFGFRLQLHRLVRNQAHRLPGERQRAVNDQLLLVAFHHERVYVELAFFDGNDGSREDINLDSGGSRLHDIYTRHHLGLLGRSLSGDSETQLSSERRIHRQPLCVVGQFDT